MVLTARTAGTKNSSISPIRNRAPRRTLADAPSRGEQGQHQPQADDGPGKRQAEKAARLVADHHTAASAATCAARLR
jgi:hypothetical protein